MRRKFVSCAMAGALVLSTPLTAGTALAADRSDGAQDAPQAEEMTLQDKIKRFKELHRKLDAGVTAEEKVAIDWELSTLEADLKAAGVEVDKIDWTVPDEDEAAQDGTEDSVAGEGETTLPEDEAATDGDSEESQDQDAVSGEDGDKPETGEGSQDEGNAEGPEADGSQDDVNPDGSAEDAPETPGAEDPAHPEVPEAQPEPEAPAVQEPVQEPQAPVANTPASSLPLVPSASFDSGEAPSYDYTEDMDTEKFIALIGEQARAIAQENDLYASVMIAQAILESGSGTSDLAKAPNNNLFGIKGVWEDEEGEEHSVSYLTYEDDGTGALYQTVSSFRAYDTVSDSMEDYASLMREDMGFYYKGAWKEFAETYEDAAEFLQGRYATDTHYAEKLIALIETYELDRYDEALDWEPIDEDVEIKDLLAEATSHIGTPYVWGGASPLTGFDCSGLIQWSYKEALGIKLTRTTYTQCLEGQVVKFDDLHPGDLLFFEDEGDIHHVAMYLGDGFYLHAPETGDVVKVTSMEEYEPSFAVRIVQTKPAGGEGELAPTPWDFRGLISTAM